MTLTQEQYRAMIRVQQTMAEAGWHPSIAGRLIRRATNRLLARADAGMGRIQLRRIRHEDPGIPPRQVVSGGRCRHIQEVPGQEERLYEEVNRLQGEGWNVMEVPGGGGFPKLKTYYACPPGAVPSEAQGQVLQSEPWGAPLYV